VRFIVDMCMDVRVASWLNSQGHDATHLRDEGLQRLPNGGVFEKAIAESRVVVTFDLGLANVVSSKRDCFENLPRRGLKFCRGIRKTGG
jgi:predicted nuclease of predicted toxin-antitoxin system